jgi:hypothetical protein
LNSLPDLPALQPADTPCGGRVEIAAGAPGAVERLCDVLYAIEFLPGVDAMCGAELYSRLGEDKPGWRYHIALPTHSTDFAGADPWKLCNNTILFRSNTNNSGAGQDRDGPRGGPPHEVYNNIFVQQSDHRLARDEGVGDGAEIFDGNLYHRTVPNARAPLFQPWHNGEESRSFISLDEFRSSDFARATRSHYPPGWEQAGVEADPMLRDPGGRDYRPAHDGPAASGALDLSAKGWPGADGAGYRGAVDPRALTGLGEVGLLAAPLPAGCTARSGSTGRSANSR